MSKTWTFIGGVLAGIVSVFAAAGVATELEARKGNNSDGQKEAENAASQEGDETHWAE